MPPTLLLLAVPALLAFPVGAGAQPPASPAGRAAAATADTVRRAEVRYHNGGVELAATLHLPAADGPVPAVVVAHGSGDSDRSNPWTSAYVEALARRGIAVLHPDKRGSGASGGDWRSASFPELAADVAAGAALLRARPEVDARRVGVLAFSQGGYVAAVLAAEDTTLAFTAVISGGTATLSRQTADEVVRGAARDGAPLTPAEEDTLRAVYAGLFAQVRDGRGWAALQERVGRARAQSPRLAAALRTVPPDSSHWAVGWVRRTGDFDPLPYWRRARRPVALVYGGRDANVDARASIERLWDAVGADAPHVSLLLLQGNGHALYRDDVVAFLERWIRDGGS